MIEYKEKYPDVKIIKKLDKNLKNISGSMSHLTKVVMNLLCNAYEFMPKGGKLTITTSSIKLEIVYLLEHRMRIKRTYLCKKVC